MSTPCIIQPDPTWPQYNPVKGWRKWLTVLGLRRKAVFIYCAGRTESGVLMFGCHPESVPALKRWLDSKGATYTMDVRLKVVSEGQQ